MWQPLGEAYSCQVIERIFGMTFRQRSKFVPLLDKKLFWVELFLHEFPYMGHAWRDHYWRLWSVKVFKSL